ncbi:MAG: UbiA family prenyltransferase [Salibacter sp.]|uniref:UbiA family prenyltransferase n=1 Tax=Salibacter sp. TaxID=2010995 RepID=UPI00287072A8|nr:UbiA family prenyltransferase [Salibacter sp.]MDR9399058.1 UbiA family prenyltransferase [Salibacter sp.]
MNKLLNFFLFSNLYVLLVIAALIGCTQLTVIGGIQVNETVWFILFSTLALYPAHRLYGVIRSKSSQLVERVYFMNEYKTVLAIIVLIGLVGTGYYFLELSWEQQKKVLIPSFVGLAYSFPVIPINGKFIRLRDLPYIKVFAISAVVSYLTTVFLPVTEMLSSSASWGLFLKRFFFLLAITLPFDIRDLRVDKREGLRTIPNQMGIKVSKWISGIALLSYVLLALLFVALTDSEIILFVAQFITAAWVLFFLVRTKPNRSEYFYSFGFEGAAIVEVILLLILVNLI